MAVTKTSNYLNTYTADTWTDLVAGGAGGNTLRALVITNTSASSISVQARITSSAGTALAVLLPSVSISAGSSHSLLVDIINLTASQKLQVQASAAGINFYVSGVSY